MTTTLIGYARCSTDTQDLAAQKAASKSAASPPTGSTPITG
jgi:DNA invertase Pin-like site-specific DNA recombinase